MRGNEECVVTGMEILSIYYICIALHIIIYIS